MDGDIHSNWWSDLRPSSTESVNRSIRVWWIGAAFLLVLTLGMFGNVLFTSRPVVLSDEHCDLATLGIYWRAFSVEQLRQGHLPLWNPYTFSGMPFLGGVQDGVFYPPNWLDIVLPLPRSINLDIALHVFLIGLFTYVWGSRRGLHPVAACVAAALLMFSGAYFLHVYAGHFSVFGIAWTPLVFASIESWLQTRKRGWILVGAGAVAMQILAGDLQVCFYAGVAAGLLMMLELVHAGQRWKGLWGFLIMYLAGAALGAVQFLTTLQAASESVRGGGISYEFASMVSFAPESFLALLAPGFFGDMFTVPYWGRWYLWEMCLFIGVCGLTLAVYGATCGKKELRRSLVPLAVIMLILALGSNTPLFKVLYHWIPGFDRLRTNAKFIMEASLFMVMLAGAGLDWLLRGPQNNRWWALGLLICGLAIGAGAIGLRSAALASGSNSWWSHAMQAIHTTQESYAPAATYTDPASVRQSGVFASKCLFVTASELIALSGLWLLTGKSRHAVYAVGLVAVIEIFIFAKSTLTTFDLASTQAPKLKAFLDEHPGDYRILYERSPNIAMWLGKEDVWGYASLVLRRYAEFMAFTQGQPLETASQYLDFSRFHPLHAMLRWRYAFTPGKDGDRLLTMKAVMPRLSLVHEYRVLSQRDEILQAMNSPSFDPRQTVILESEPDPAPAPSSEMGTVTLVDSSASQLTVEADLPHPAILLITDAYSSGWRARPLDGGVQQVYRVLPANYVLRAIPLSRGHHRIRIEYLPAAFQEGMWISIASTFCFVLAAGYCLRKNGSD